MACRECSSWSSLAARYCVGCGNPLTLGSGSDVPPPVLVASPLMAVQSASYKSLSRKEQYQAAIGPNTQYYLNQFMQFDREGKPAPSWHWPAFFIPVFWLLYRKMWCTALIYITSLGIGLLIIGIVAGMWMQAGPVMTGLLELVFMTGLGVIPALYANSWYYQHCRRLIARVHKQSGHPHRLYGMLSTRGGTARLFRYPYRATRQLKASDK